MIFSSAMRGCVLASEGKAGVYSSSEGWTKDSKAQNILYSCLLRHVTAICFRIFGRSYRQNGLRRREG